MYYFLHLKGQLTQVALRNEIKGGIPSELLYLPTPLVDGQTSWFTLAPLYTVYTVQSLYISCYVAVNKSVLSHLLLCLLPQW